MITVAATSGSYRATSESSTDRVIRLSTAAAVLAVAGIAAYVSYWHAYAVVRAHGESGITAQLEPTTIDGLVYASSMVILYAARHRVPVPPLARWLLGLGITATLTANMAQGWSHGPVGAVVAAWPAASLVGSYELLVWLIRASGHPDASHQLSSTARVRRAVVRRVPSQLGPLTAGSTAAATPIRALRADDRRISLPGIRLPLSADSKVTGLPGQMPIIAQRWPRTGSARKSAIRSPNASSLRCSGAPPAAGHAPGSPKRSDHPYPSNAVTRQQRVGVAGLRRHLRYVTAAATGVRPVSLPIIYGVLCSVAGAGTERRSAIYAPVWLPGFVRPGWC